MRVEKHYIRYQCRRPCWIKHKFIIEYYAVRNEEFEFTNSLDSNEILLITVEFLGILKARKKPRRQKQKEKNEIAE